MEGGTSPSVLIFLLRADNKANKPLKRELRKYFIFHALPQQKIKKEQADSIMSRVSSGSTINSEEELFPLSPTGRAGWPRTEAERALKSLQVTLFWEHGVACFLRLNCLALYVQKLVLFLFLSEAGKLHRPSPDRLIQ